MKEQPVLIDFDQAAKLASVCRRTVANWAKSRAITTIKIGRTVRVDRTQFIEELRRFARPAAA